MGTQRFCGVVAIDGPSGSGKSTAARLLADELRTHYLDTGAMYRGVTVAVLRNGVDPADAVAVEKALSACTLTVGTEPSSPTISVDNQSVDVEIRTPEVTAAVSAVASHSALRQSLVAQQQSIIRDAMSDTGARCGIVVEGRDIGTVVAPDADLKVYLTASADERASRRHQEGTQGQARTATVKEQLEKRDRADSTRSVDPLRRASDAAELDTTDLTPREVVATLLSLLTQKVSARTGAQR